MSQANDQVIIGVDPHKLSATIEVVDQHEQRLGSGRFTTDRAGYAAMRKYAGSWPERVWAVEGSNGAGRPLAQRHLEDGEHVVDVPAKLAARVRLFDTGHNRKTDAHDAHAVAAVAVRTHTLRVLQLDGELEALRMLTDRREALTRRRVQTVDRLQALLAELLPGQAKRDITTGQAKTMLASVRPRDIAGKTRRRIAAEELAELVAVEAKIKKSTADLKAIVLARGSHLMDLHGVGPVVAARTLADVGDVARFADRNRFASWTGTAPLDASSGEQNPAPAVPGREPTDEPHDPHRRDESDPPRHRWPRLLPTQASRGQEATRSSPMSQAQDLRRDLPPARRRRSTRCCRRSGWHGSGRAPQGVSRIQRGRPSPAHRHFGSATSRTRDQDARPNRLTTEGSRNDSASAHRRICAPIAVDPDAPPRSITGISWPLPGPARAAMCRRATLDAARRSARRVRH